ncbi:MAG: aminoglycoside phosphotransferase family protein [Caldilineaceae bacterium]
MSTPKMHADELHIDAAVVRRLLADQLPQWAQLPLRPVASAGTDHALYRLGDAMLVRLPRIHWAVGQAKLEAAWLPKLAPHLPLAVPLPLAMGNSTDDYPWTWSVCRWLPGVNATPDQIADSRQAAADLAGFIRALQAVDATGAPRSSRGVPLASRDAEVRAALAALDTLPRMIDTTAAAAAWDATVRAPAWQAAPVWIHGDLHQGNLLAQDGRLSAVIDFGCLGLGDPAVDVMAAWLYLPRDVRAEFREMLHVDDATWTRAQGWALSMGLIALPYYHVTNPALAGIARRTIEAVLADGVA